MTNPTEPAPLLSAAELELVDLLGEVANTFIAVIGPATPDRTAVAGDVAEAVYHIHALQNMVLAQAAARAYPTRFRPLGGSLVEGSTGG